MSAARPEIIRRAPAYGSDRSHIGGRRVFSQAHLVVRQVLGLVQSKTVRCTASSSPDMLCHEDSTCILRESIAAFAAIAAGLRSADERINSSDRIAVQDCRLGAPSPCGPGAPVAECGSAALPADSVELAGSGLRSHRVWPLT